MNSWLVKGLMLFLTISFSIWGIGDIFRGKPLQQRTVATVGNSSISVQQLNHLFDETLAQARQKIAPDLTAQQARQIGLLDKTLDKEIKRELIDMDIRRLGIDASQKAVLKMLASQPQLRNKDGSFNRQLFEQILEHGRLSEQGFIAQERQELSRRILLTALEGIPAASQTAVDALYEARAQKRILDVVTVDASKIGGIAAPDDKALHAFYDGNPALFMAPEYRSLTVASLSTDDLAKDVSITDDQLKKEYDSRHDQLAQPERRDIVQVVVENEDKAKHLAEQARAQGDLAGAAKEEKESAVPLDGLEQNSLMPDLSKVVFAMHEGEISAPVKTQLGWHVIALKKITPAGVPSFDTIKEKLRADMRRDQAIDEATRIVNRLDDQLAAGRSLDDIANELKLHLVKISGIDAKGLLQNGKEPEELPDGSVILKDAFAQNVGDTSPVEDDKKGNYYIVSTDNITPSGVRPFEAAKDRVVAAWKAHEQALKAEAEAGKIAKALRDGKAASAFDSDEGVTSRTSAPLSQLDDTDAGLPQDLRAQVFKIKKGEVATATEGDKQIVARLAGIVNVDAVKADPRKNRIAGEIKKSEGNELLDQYLEYLRTIFPVKTDAALLEQLREQGSD